RKVWLSNTLCWRRSRYGYGFRVNVKNYSIEEGCGLLDKKTVIITGGSSGIGKALAIDLAKEEYNIVITGRNQEKLESAKREIESINNNISIFQMDIRNIEDVEELVTFTVTKYGSIDTLINNAAGNFI